MIFFPVSGSSAAPSTHMSVSPDSARAGRHVARLGFCVSVLLLAAASAGAQELAPRAYWPAPTGTNALITSYQYNTGDIVTDPSLPITGVESRINFAQLGWQRVFALRDRTASVQISLPYSWGLSEGFAEGEFRSRETSGIADLRARLTVNLMGAPSMDGAGFQALRAKPRPIVGASLLIQAPTGEYEPDKLLNIGTNRWAAKPALGLVWPLRPTWLFEAEAGVWLYGNNDNFLGATRKQDPILSSEAHLIKRIRPGFWASLDANFYVGGRTIVDGEKRLDLQRNSRFGVTLVVPFKPGHAIRAGLSTGVVTESGGNFEIFSLSYLYYWR